MNESREGMRPRRQLSRRELLWGSLVASGGLATIGGLGPLLRLADAAGTGRADRHYIFCYFSGGWDTLLSLDPRDPAQFNAANMSETLIYPAYELLTGAPNGGAPYTLTGPSGPVSVGPFFGELRQPSWASRLAIVRGMSMETLTHEVGRRRFLTGKPPSGLLARGSSAATLLAGALGADDIIPNISVNVESYNVDQPIYASALKVDSVSDLIRALEETPSNLGPTEAAALSAFLANEAGCPAAAPSDFWQAAEASRLKAREMVSLHLDGLFDFLGASPEMQALRAFYGIDTTAADPLGTPEAQAAMAVTALTANISRVVSVRLASGLDTHFSEWLTDAGPFQMSAFDLVAKMAEDLEGREYTAAGDGSSWLDHTTIVGFSEFSRGALLNAASGRDHSLTNACFLLGGNVKPGPRVLGASTDVGLAPSRTNLTTGLSDEGGDVLRPEHVIRALLTDAGVTEDIADLRVDPLTAIFNP